MVVIGRKNKNNMNKSSKVLLALATVNNNSFETVGVCR
jgi:hypothetical protein